MQVGNRTAISKEESNNTDHFLQTFLPFWHKTCRLQIQTPFKKSITLKFNNLRLHYIPLHFCTFSLAYDFPQSLKTFPINTSAPSNGENCENVLQFGELDGGIYGSASGCITSKVFRETSAPKSEFMSRGRVIGTLNQS